MALNGVSMHERTMKYPENRIATSDHTILRSWHLSVAQQSLSIDVEKGCILKANLEGPGGWLELRMT